MEPRTRTLYVRNVPDRLMRSARALAAESGITLGALVVEALEARTAKPVATTDLSDDIAWFEQHRQELVAEYEGQYVAIVGGAVVDHDVDLDALAGRVFAAGGVRSVFMPLVQPEERVVNTRSPRRA